MTKDEICGLLRQIHDVLAMQSETNHWAKPVAEQEPVAWYYPDGSPEQCTTDKAYAEMEPAWTPLYTIPPQRTWVGLTDEEIQECLNRLPTQTIDVYARRIEAKIREKNGL
jgi:hypothetical protein